MSATSFAARAMTEQQLQESVEELAALLGWWAWHDQDSRRNRAGLPDLILVRRNRLMWCELKTQDGRIRPEQRHVLAMLQTAGQVVHLWRPSDWLDGTIRKELT
jgi:hypothetical protein